VRVKPTWNRFCIFARKKETMRIMKSVRFLSLLALVLIVVPSALAADFGVRAGRMNESDSNFVGAEVLVDLGFLNLNPNVEYLLEDDVTAGSLNLDFTFDVATFARVTPYVGAGLGLSYTDVDGAGGEETDLLGNLIGGVQFNLSAVKPYAQVKYFRLLDDNGGGGDDDEIALTVGVRF
jgi:hypothetical protein